MPEVVSSIVSVVVYPDRARVTRRSSVELEAGLQRVLFPGLPLELDADSLRAYARGSVPGRLLGASVRRVPGLQTPVEPVRERERHLETLEDKDRSLIGEEETLAADSERIGNFSDQAEAFARGYAAGRVTIETHGALYDFVENRLRKIRERRLAIQIERRELAREIARLKREMKSLSSLRAVDRNAVEVEIEASAKGTFSVDIVYVVPGAHWTPLYDLRLNGSLSVQYLASVAQTTGEDWQQVELTLSAAFPSRNMIVPDLTPWIVRPHLPPPRMQAHFAGAPAAAGPMMMSESSAHAPEMEESLEVMPDAPSTVVSSGAAVSYAVGGHADIPSDGSGRKVTVGRFDLSPEVDYVTAPALIGAVYRRMTVQNTSPFLLLAGRAQIFEGDEYLGSVPVEAAAPGGSWELSLGVDERVRVERALKLDETDKKLMGDVRRVRRRYEIELENLTGREIHALVRDRIPVSRHEAIQVKLAAARPKPDENELGLLEWRITIPDRSKSTVSLEFVIEYPKEMNVTGLGD